MHHLWTLKHNEDRTTIYSITLDGTKLQHVHLFTLFCFCLYFIVPYTLTPNNINRKCTTISTYFVIPFYVFGCSCSLLINAVHFLRQCSKPAFNVVQLCWIQEIRFCIQLLCHLYKTLVLCVQWQTCLRTTTNVTCICCMENELNKTNTNYSTSCVLGYFIFHTGFCRDDLWQQFNVLKRNNDTDCTILSEVAPNTVSSLCSRCSKSATRETCIICACSGRYVNSYVTVPLCLAGWVFIVPNFWDGVPPNLRFSSWASNFL